MKKSIVTGASGFLGYHLVNKLQQANVFVYALVRRGSKTKERLRFFNNIKIIELDMENIIELKNIPMDDCECFYHLAWEGAGDDFSAQCKNIDYTLNALEMAKDKGCRRFVCTGSQAEYGLYDSVITENLLPNPNTAYGSVKLSTNYLTKIRALQLDIEWVWVRVFSVYGLYDRAECLIPYVVQSLKNIEMPNLTKCLQNWDYLHADDAAAALIILAESGHSGEVYNLASGDGHPLRFFVEKIGEIMDKKEMLFFGKNERRVVSLLPSIKKLQEHTGWNPKISFREGIDDIIEKNDFKGI